MTTHTAPAISTLVEMTASDEPVNDVRVVEIAGSRLTLLPPANAPVVVGRGDDVTLRWAAGERGRYRVDGRVVAASAAGLVVALMATPEIEQHRRHVRGGGGEQVRMHRAGANGVGEAAGWIRDISEQALRAQFPAVLFGDGDVLRITIDLDGNTIEVRGVAKRITVRPPEAPGPASTAVEVLAMLDTDEAQAQLIRRYLLRQQTLNRARTAA